MSQELNQKVNKALRNVSGVKSRMLRDISDEVMQVVRAIDKSQSEMASAITSVVKAVAEQKHPDVVVDTEAIGKEVAKAIAAIPQQKPAKAGKAVVSQPTSYEAVVTERDARGNLKKVRFNPVS